MVNFSDYVNYTCVNAAYKDFTSKFLSTVDSVAPIRTVRVKANTKPWFDNEVLIAIRYRDKLYKRCKQTGTEDDIDCFKAARSSLKKMINIKKKLYFEEKLRK